MSSGTSKVSGCGATVTFFPALLTVSPVRDERGNAIGLSVIARDISDQKRSEESLRETQKLESLGLLAGGIAHTSIICSLESLGMQVYCPINSQLARASPRWSKA